MAISSFPSPADAGVLCMILANTAMSISIFKELVRSILHVIGIHIASWDEFSPEPSECRPCPSESYMDEFRSRMPAMRYDSVFACDCPLNQECSICLSEFERTAEINRLPCGHVFHRSCLEKWLNYWNMTCPLCRNCMMPQEEEDACPISESFDPTERLPILRSDEDFLCRRHLKEPTCVVGEHEQLFRTLAAFRRPTTGFDGKERFTVSVVSTDRFGLGFAFGFPPVLGSSALILVSMDIGRNLYGEGT